MEMKLKLFGAALCCTLLIKSIEGKKLRCYTCSDTKGWCTEGRRSMTEKNTDTNTPYAETDCPNDDEFCVMITEGTRTSRGCSRSEYLAKQNDNLCEMNEKKEGKEKKKESDVVGTATTDPSRPTSVSGEVRCCDSKLCNGANDVTITFTMVTLLVAAFKLLF